MIDKIKKIYSETNFDFRVFSNPDDKLSYLFTEWVPYYRMKYAICKEINPRSILEIGVRYGYSAITFLNASENATYLGIDTNTDSFGGARGAIEWAKKITSKYSADFIIADTQKMQEFPGVFYDFIHIDGQQDGDGTFHDMELALPKARWILVDGYFWSTENMISSTYFLNKYNKFIEYAIIIPSYGGDLLIKTKDSAKNFKLSFELHADQKMRKEYDNTYFLKDCGGYDSFKKYKGKQLTDERLLTVLYLATPNRDMSILDLGCGRGELCYALAQTGAFVTGIDYSPSAIAIAENAFRSSISKDKLDFICEDILNFAPNKKFDRIIATDFVEHIEKNRFDIVLQKVAGFLKPGGLFILHTSPNALNYGVPYEEKRAIARSIGGYLPKNPRTHYEDLMHINEQTPELLRIYLEKYFPYSMVWVATAPEISGSLGRTFSPSEIMKARSIFAIASKSSLDRDRILNQLIQKPLDINRINANITVHSFPASVISDELFSISLTLDNLSGDRWVSLQPNPIHLAYHWLDENGEYIVYDGIRTAIHYPLFQGESRHFFMNVVAPKTSGNYVLQVTLVQESCFWFETIVENLPISLMIKTKPNEK
jgi:cyclopropane fatty-acyl-phospholipid synthase-like methyltransferase